MDCLAVRSDVPQEIVDKLNAMLDDVYADSKFTGFMDEMGYPLWNAKGDEVTKFIEDPDGQHGQIRGDAPVTGWSV